MSQATENTVTFEGHRPHHLSLFVKASFVGIILGMLYALWMIYPLLQAPYLTETGAPNMYSTDILGLGHLHNTLIFLSVTGVLPGGVALYLLGRELRHSIRLQGIREVSFFVICGAFGGLSTSALLVLLLAQQDAQMKMRHDIANYKLYREVVAYRMQSTDQGCLMAQKILNDIMPRSSLGALLQAGAWKTLYLPVYDEEGLQIISPPCLATLEDLKERIVPLTQALHREGTLYRRIPYLSSMASFISEQPLLSAYDECVLNQQRQKVTHFKDYTELCKEHLESTS